MRGSHVEHLLCGYIDGTLPPHAARKVTSHLAACGDCARELARWRAVLHLVSHHAPMSCPIDCAEMVVRTLEARRGERLIEGTSNAQTQVTQSFFQRIAWHSRPVSWPPFFRVAAVAAALALIGGVSHRSISVLHASARPAGWTVAGGHTPGSTGAPIGARRDRWAINASLDSARRPLRARGPDRLQEAFGRSDSLILAADFVEDDR
jgi:anti-sigma factor RsiW